MSIAIVAKQRLRHPSGNGFVIITSWPSLAAGPFFPYRRFTDQRDLAVAFADEQHWEAKRDDDIPRRAMVALDQCIGEHHPLFFDVKAFFDVAGVSEPSEQAKSPPPATPRDFIIAEKGRLESVMPPEERRTVEASPVRFPLVIWGLFEQSHPRRG